jgi:hypothetical protein
MTLWSLRSAQRCASTVDGRSGLELRWLVCWHVGSSNSNSVTADGNGDYTRFPRFQPAVDARPFQACSQCRKSNRRYPLALSNEYALLRRFLPEP